MAKNLRVHELAKELGMTNAETVDLFGKLGVPVKSHSSSLNEAYADMVRRRAERDGLTRDEQPAEPEPEKKPAKKAPAKKVAAKKAPAKKAAAKKAPAKKAAAKQAADLKKLKAMMAKMGLSAADVKKLMTTPVMRKGASEKTKAKRKTGPRKGKKVAPKYQLKVGKETHKWTGRGRMPLVFKEFVGKGGSLEKCLIKK